MTGVVSLTCDASIWEADAGVHGHPGLHSKFEASLNYMRPCPQNKKKELLSMRKFKL